MVNAVRAGYVSGASLIALGVILSNTVAKGAFIIETPWTIPLAFLAVVSFLSASGILAAADWSSPTVFTERHRFHFHPEPPRFFTDPRGLHWVAIPGGGKLWRKGYLSPANFGLSGAKGQIVFCPSRLWEARHDAYPILRGTSIRMDPGAVKTWLGVQAVSDIIQSFGADPERVEFYMVLFSTDNALHPDSDHSTDSVDIAVFEDLMRKDAAVMESEQSKTKDRIRDTERNWIYISKGYDNVPQRSRRRDRDDDRENRRDDE